MSRRLAMFVLRLYPRAWRERYEDEVRALLEQAPVTSRQAVDLMLACSGEWARRAASSPVRSIVARGTLMLGATWSAHLLASLAVAQFGVALPSSARLPAAIVVMGIFVRLWLLAMTPPSTSASPSNVVPHEGERRAVGVSLKLNSTERTWPNPSAVEAKVLTVLALIAFLVEYAAWGTSEIPVPLGGPWLVGFIAVMWVFRSPRHHVPEPVL